MRRGDRWRAVGLIMAVAPILSVRPAPGDDRPATSGDADLPRLVHLAAGTPVDGALPDGWSARVIRSVPRLASGEVSTLPDSAKTSATLFRTAILADVAGGRGGFRLRRVGVGNAVPSGGRDVVVTPEGPADVRASLSTVERIVANAAYDEISRGRLAARTPTFALLRTPARLAVDGVHRPIDLYYAILTDPANGAVRALAWWTALGKPAAPPRLTALPPDLTFDCPLDVAVDGRIGPLNVSWSFAMASPPPGRPVDVAPDLARRIESIASGRGDPAALEEALRALLDASGDR